MAYKVIIYEVAREEVVKEEEEADMIADRENRINGNYCQVVECSDDELDK